MRVLNRDSLERKVIFDISQKFSLYNDTEGEDVIPLRAQRGPGGWG